MLQRCHWYTRARVRVMVFNATFNNISVISWRSVSLVEETGVPEKNHRPVMDYNVVSSIPRLNGIRIDIRKFRRWIHYSMGTVFTYLVNGKILLTWHKSDAWECIEKCSGTKFSDWTEKWGRQVFIAVQRKKGFFGFKLYSYILSLISFFFYWLTC